MKNLLLLFVVILVSCSSEPKPYTPDYSTTEGVEEFARKAFITAQEYVKDNLKSPSTAKFPFLEYSWSDPDTATNTIIIKSHVDAQNAFGATIRNTFYVKLKFNGGLWEEKSNWSLIDIQLK